MKYQNWVSCFMRYFSKQNLSVALLGFSSGLPILMTLSTLTYWLSTLNIEKGTIGLASLLGLPYLLKFLWAPLLDIFHLPILGKLGRRKGWIIFFQILIALIFVVLAWIDPLESPYLLGFMIFLLAFASASQDIVVDAYRIDYLDKENQAYGASGYLFMYRIAMLFMGAGVLMLSDSYSWSFIFQMIAILVGIIIVLTLMIPEPKSEKATEIVAIDNETASEALLRVLNRFIEGFVHFFQRERAPWFLLLVVCYKLPDAVSGVMVTNFYYESGFTGTQIGLVTKVYGLIATLVGAFLAGTIINQLGLYKSLIISAILIGITNLGYLLIIIYPGSTTMLTVAISAENFISGFSSALFIMFLGLLCDRNASATQYALLSALAAFGLRILGGASGFMVEGLGWTDFFIMTAVLFIPSLILIIMLRSQIQRLKAPE
ncbi:MFS transporter [Ignatzschineria larvae DSM 13226]|uniref:MFS transporter n=1 Tax=Ignatzschineria larvae DSM 13226 TaxID=1111732 RepID=A0ABZ3BYU2_9GAMM|nr:MFS transporter [Ignatzschineria larvae]